MKQHGSTDSVNERRSIVLSNYEKGNYWQDRMGQTSDFKVRLVESLMSQENITIPNGVKIAEIGCGNGAFLLPLHKSLTNSNKSFELLGYDIATNAISSANEHAKQLNMENIEFKVGSFDSVDPVDIIFLMDIVEHVINPFDALSSVLHKCNLLILHLPIEQSVAHILLSKPTQSHKVFQHLYFFSLETALILIRECGYEIVAKKFSAASTEILTFNGSIITKLFRAVRFLSYKLAPALSSRLFGGSVMLILKNRSV